MNSKDNILILNRGEIALRAIRASKELGLNPVLFCTPSDTENICFRECHEVFVCESDELQSSYQNLDYITEAIKKFNIKYLYPGYGLLSEKPELPKLCNELGVIFIGPNSNVMAHLASKQGALEFAKMCKLPTLKINSLNEKTAFPILLKAVHGGGGRGHKLVKSFSELQKAKEGLINRSKNLFGDGTLIAERFLTGARHVELQVFCDTKFNVSILGTRDCSVQRNYQKIIEEGPIGSGARDLLDKYIPAIKEHLKNLKYTGLLTLEFLCDKENKNVYFLEANCRIQVEHPLTEELFDLDLVKLQISAFVTESIDLSPAHGSKHIMEFRIYGEDVKKGFLPQAGKIQYLKVPNHRNIRFDTFVESGDKISEHYDTLIGKLIVSGISRRDVLLRSQFALEELIILGVKTNIPYLLFLLEHDDFIEDKHHINWLPEFVENAKEDFVLKTQNCLLKLKSPFERLSQPNSTSQEYIWKNSHRS